MRVLIQSCRTARAQLTTGSSVENDCELKKYVAEAVVAAEDDDTENVGGLNFETFPSKANTVVSAARTWPTFLVLDEIKRECPHAEL